MGVPTKVGMNLGADGDISPNVREADGYNILLRKMDFGIFIL